MRSGVAGALSESWQGNANRRAHAWVCAGPAESHPGRGLGVAVEAAGASEALAVVAGAPSPGGTHDHKKGRPVAQIFFLVHKA